MILEALGLFLREIAAGTALALWFFPTRALGRGFFALHGLIAAAASAGALALSGASPDPVSWAAAGALAGFTVLANGGWSRAALPLLAAGGLLESAAIVSQTGRLAPFCPAWAAAGSILGGLLFGSVLLTMNLGHWYLVSRALPIRMLFHASIAFVGLVVARAAFVGLAAFELWRLPGWDSLTSLERNGLFFLFRIVWGVAGPLGLSYFVYRTARMKSNQAATGLLYVALVFVLIGEFLSAYLTSVTGFPA